MEIKIKKNKNFKNNFNFKSSSSNSKKKRKFNTHSEQGSVSSPHLRKENQKLGKTLKNFNKTYLKGEYTKILSNWPKEVRKINKYLINAERTIDLSVLKLASIITEDKMYSLNKILYYKYNQIYSHVNEFINLTSIQTDNYINLLDNSSLLLQKTFEEVNNIIIFDFL